MTDTALSTAQADASALAPLRRPGFRAAWTALAGSQLVIWMNTVGAVTVIASLSGSPTLIALVQTANSVPAVLLALVMGSMADIVDRRRFAIASQTWMLLSVATLAALTLGDVITPALALGLTFALGAGMATTFVIYQALTQDFVPRSELLSAVALNGVAINLARAIGPALAGLIIAAFSAGALFAVEAGLLVLIVALVAFRVRPPGPARASGERFAPAVRAGIRFVRFSPPVRTVLLRGAAFSVSASALWALLPVVALGRLGLSDGSFGLLMGCVGVGAILAATMLPRLRRRFAFDHMIALASLGLAGGLLALAYLPWAELVAFTLVLTGACWLTVLSSLNTSAQRVAPGWVRARTLAAFQLVMQGGLAVGSLTWGLADRSGLGRGRPHDRGRRPGRGGRAGAPLAARRGRGQRHDPSRRLVRPQRGHRAAARRRPGADHRRVPDRSGGGRAVRARDGGAGARSGAATARTGGACTETSSSPACTSRRSSSTPGPSTCASTSASPWPTSS